MKWAQWEGRLADVGSAPYEGRGACWEALAALPRPAQVAALAIPEARAQAFARFCARAWDLAPVWYGAHARAFGIENRYRPAESLGADRYAALIAARARFPGRALQVVDCGTAITIDALDAQGVFHGGVILPGLGLGARALAAAAGLPVPPLAGEVSALGCATGAALRGGEILGIAGGVDRLLAEQRAVLGHETRVVVTGGDAPRLGPYLCQAFDYVPDLPLAGLAVMAA